MTSNNTDCKEMKSKEPIYSSIIYPPDHFSLSNGHDASKPDCKEGWLVTILQYKKGPCYMVKINPTDSRGYRLIVRLVERDAAKMKDTLNRPYTLLEKQGLSHVLATIAHVYELCFKLVAQIEIAGNNAHDFRVTDDENIFLLGKESEPIMLHGHLWFRGHPEHVYFPSFLPGQKLGGPRPGQPFNGRGDARQPGPGGDKGNMSKNKWSSNEEIRIFANYLENCLRPLF